MDNIFVKALEILVGNSVTVTLLIIGALCVIVAIIGEIPSLRDKITGIKALFLGLFGILLMLASVGLAWVLASSTTGNAASPTPTSVAQVIPVLQTNAPTDTLTAPPVTDTLSTIVSTSVNTPLPTNTLISPSNTPDMIATFTTQPTNTPLPPTATYTSIPTPTLLPPTPIPTRISYAERLCPSAVTQILRKNDGVPKRKG